MTTNQITPTIHVCDCGTVAHIENMYTSCFGGLVCGTCLSKQVAVEDIERIREQVMLREIRAEDGERQISELIKLT
jgi:ferredoxin